MLLANGYFDLLGHFCTIGQSLLDLIVEYVNVFLILNTRIFNFICEVFFKGVQMRQFDRYQQVQFSVM